MVVQHQVGAIRHDDAGRPVGVVDVDAVFDESVQLLEEGGYVDDYTVADDASGVGMDEA